MPQVTRQKTEQGGGVIDIVFILRIYTIKVLVSRKNEFFIKKRIFFFTFKKTNSSLDLP